MPVTLSDITQWVTKRTGNIWFFTPHHKNYFIRYNNFFSVTYWIILHSYPYIYNTALSTHTSTSFYFISFLSLHVNTVSTTHTYIYIYIYIPLPLHHIHSLYLSWYLLYTPNTTTHYQDVVNHRHHQNRILISQFQF